MKPVATPYRKRDIARAFGLALRAARVERGLTQERLCELCDVDRTYPSLVERGLRCPSLAMLLRLASALRIDPARLINETVQRLPTT